MCPNLNKILKALTKELTLEVTKQVTEKLRENRTRKLLESTFFFMTLTYNYINRTQGGKI